MVNINDTYVQLMTFLKFYDFSMVLIFLFLSRNSTSKNLMYRKMKELEYEYISHDQYPSFHFGQ